MGNTAELKQRNLLDIIRVIKTNSPISKPEIARLTGLTSVTAHNFINELFKLGLVEEYGVAGSNGGRKAVLYRLSPGFFHIIGQNLGVDYIETGIFDLELNMLYKDRTACPTDYSEKIKVLMEEKILSAAGQLNLKRENCLGVGISVPGQVDHERGVVVNLTHVPGWNGIPLKNIIQDKTGMTVIVDNDNNANALAAKWLNLINENSNAVFLSITNGVGTGILIKGRVFYGSHSSTGEIGHTSIQYDGPSCNCGNRGCIEVLTSDFAIIAKVAAYILPEGDIGTVVKAAKEGNEHIYGILKETCDLISIAIDHIFKLYGPEVIIIQSNWLGEFPDLYYYIQDRVFARCRWLKREDLRILLNTTDNINIIGASALVLERALTYTDNNPLLKILSR